MIFQYDESFRLIILQHNTVLLRYTVQNDQMRTRMASLNSIRQSTCQHIKFFNISNHNKFRYFITK